MIWGKFKDAIEKEKFKVKMGTISQVSMAITICMLSFFYWQAMKKERTIIIPSTVLAQLEVSDIDASPQFIRVNVSFALSLLYSYTPTSAAERFEEFLIAYVQADKVKELREILLDRLRQIQSVKVSETIEVEDIVFEQRGALLVRSKVHRYTLGHPIATEPLYLRILYRIHNGNLKISSLVNLSVADYTRLLRVQQLEAKKVEEKDRRRDRKKKQDEEAAKRESLRLDAGREQDPRAFGGEANTSLQPSGESSESQ